jgi:tetratricopeptide (TPR) repeat protein
MMLETPYSKTLMIGRNEESKELDGYLDEMSSSQGRLVFITGEVGIGKSNFIETFKKNHLEEGLLFLGSRCMYQERADPYQPIYEVLGQYKVFAGDTDSESIRKIVEVLPNEVQKSIKEPSPSLLPLGLIPTGGLEEEAEEDSKSQGEVPLFSLTTNLQESGFTQDLDTEELNKHFAEIFHEISKESPLVLVIEDLQWADTSTIFFLKDFGMYISDKPILVIGTYNYDAIEETDPVHPLLEVVKFLRAENISKTIRLKRFDKTQVKELLANMLETEDIPSKIVDIFFDKTQGNPYFLKEVVRGLITDGTIDLNDTLWYNKLDMAHVKISSNIQEMMAARIERLSPDTQKVLVYASVLGTNFHFDELNSLVGKDEEYVIDALEELMSYKLIIEDMASSEERYRFDNPVVKETAYENMGRSRKRFLHKKVAQLIEERNAGDLSRVVFDLAYHYSVGKAPEKAFLYLMKAGEKALAMQALTEARNYFSEAESMLEASPATPELDQMKKGLYYDLGLVKDSTGEWDDALHYYNKALNISLMSKDPLELSKIHRSIAEIFRRRGKWEDGEEILLKAMDLSTEAKDVQGLAEANRGLGWINWRKGHYGKATKYYEDSIKYAKRVKDNSLMASIFIEVGNLYNSKGELQKSLTHYERALDLLKKTTDLKGKSRAYNNIGDVYLQQEDWDKAIAYFKESERISKEAGNTYWLGWSLFNASEAYAKKGDLVTAESHCERSFKMLKKLDDKIGITFCLRNFGLIYAKMKDFERSKANFEESLDMVQSLNMPYNEGECLVEYSNYYIEKGEKRNALRVLKRALKCFESVNAETRIVRTKDLIKELEG